MTNLNNQIDKSLYNEKSLYLLNIKELRDIGRKFGVPAPTTLKKQELVDYILKVVYGEVETEKRSSYGRPSVRNFDMNQYIEKIKRNSELTSELVKFKLDFGVSSPTEEYSSSNQVIQKVVVNESDRYFLREHAFVAEESDIELPKETVKKYGLENFDVVEIDISGDNFKIVSINGELVKASSENFGDKSGQKLVFHLRTKEEIRENIKNLIKEKQNSNILIFSDEIYQGKNVENITVNENEKSSQIYKKVNMLISLCEKYIYSNKKIVVATDKLNLVEDTIDSFDTDISDRVRKNIQEKIDRFIELGNTLVVYRIEKEFIY